MLVKGTDPTLGGIIHPLGFVKLFEGVYYVHTTLPNTAIFEALKYHPDVLKINSDATVDYLEYDWNLNEQH